MFLEISLNFTNSRKNVTGNTQYISPALNFEVTHLCKRQKSNNCLGGIKVPLQLNKGRNNSSGQERETAIGDINKFRVRRQYIITVFVFDQLVSNGTSWSRFRTSNIAIGTIFLFLFFLPLVAPFVLIRRCWYHLSRRISQ